MNHLGITRIHIDEFLARFVKVKLHLQITGTVKKGKWNKYDITISDK